MELEFRIGGGGKLGADGMALWYTKETKIEGGVFGNTDKWTGLAIIFDTFDNDGMVLYLIRISIIFTFIDSLNFLSATVI